MHELCKWYDFMCRNSVIYNESYRLAIAINVTWPGKNVSNNVQATDIIVIQTMLLECQSPCVKMDNYMGTL